LAQVDQRNTRTGTTGRRGGNYGAQGRHMMRKVGKPILMDRKFTRIP
jgi:hypothetical protein